MTQVVDDDSASLGFPQEEKGWIPANHIDMVKYDSENDTGFKRVAHSIASLVEDGLRQKESAASAAETASA
jgi:hypothetical protein